MDFDGLPTFDCWLPYSKKLVRMKSIFLVLKRIKVGQYNFFATYIKTSSPGHHDALKILFCPCTTGLCYRNAHELWTDDHE